MKFLPVAILALASNVESKSLRSNKATNNNNKISHNRSNNESHNIVLSPPIDRLIATMTLGSKPLRSLVGSSRNRKLELSPELAALFDDDYIISTLSDEDLGDKTFVQCIKDTKVVTDSNPEIKQASEEFTSTVSVSTYSEGDTLGMKMEFSNESSRENLRQTCANVGGYYDEMIGTTSCNSKFTDPNMESMVASMSGFATCTANTQACRSVDVVTGMYNIMGWECNESTGSGGVPSVPKDTQVSESASVSDSEELPSQDSLELESDIEDLGAIADLLDELLPSGDTSDMEDLGDFLDALLPSEDTEGSGSDNDDMGALGDFFDALLPSEDTEGSESEPDTDKAIDRSESESDDNLGAFTDFLGDIAETDDPGVFSDDDDTFLETLMADEDMMKCNEDAKAYPELESVMLDFTGDANMDMDLSADSMEVTMEYSDEAKKALRKTCSDIGGFYEEIDKISCTFVDFGNELTSTIIGYANCLPNTKACKAVDMEELYNQIFAAMGQEMKGEGGCEFEGRRSSSSFSSSSSYSLTGSRLTAAVLFGILTTYISYLMY